MRVVLGLLIWSVAEISAFVVVGGWIGLLGVLALVLGTGVAGVMVLRRQGVALAGALRGSGGLQAGGLGQAGLLVLGAVLLVMPGLLTDVVGLALMVAPVRAIVAARIGVRAGVGRARGYRASEDIVEATAVDLEPARLREPSGWTKP